jgi:hypothetical protein
VDAIEIVIKKNIEQNKKKPTSKGSKRSGLEPSLSCPFASPLVVAGGHVGGGHLLFVGRVEVDWRWMQ